jgi:glycosyltransferase involved in cell wall biosynthesis
MRLTLDVLVPTCRRPRTLARALRSLLAAPVPDGLDVRITVIQNDDDPQTGATLQAVAAEHPGRLAFLRESRSGKSNALNAGIRATTGDLVGVIDDDEEVDTGWFEAVAQAFTDTTVDFVGGPCLPCWGAVPPAWLPSTWRGVIGFVDDGDRVMQFGSDAPGILMGGNCVIRRQALLRVGLYSTALGPRHECRLFSCEDEDLYGRLIASGARGLYVPQLRIYHFVPSQRLTKAYYRRWSFWHGVSHSVLDRLRPVPVARIGRVPRYLIGSAVRGAITALKSLRRDHATRLTGELACLQFLGFLYGSYWCRREWR